MSKEISVELTFVNDDDFLMVVHEMFDAIYMDMKSYLERVRTIHDHVRKNYNSIKSIRKDDVISSRIFECEGRFSEILVQIVKLENGLVQYEPKSRKVRIHYHRIYKIVERIITSVMKNTDSFVFNYSLKRSIATFINTCPRYQSKTLELMHNENALEKDKLSIWD